jgi:hypothetical protein
MRVRMRGFTLALVPHPLSFHLAGNIPQRLGDEGSRQGPRIRIHIHPCPYSDDSTHHDRI